MPITPTYPGVYVEEMPSGVRTITGVSTSVTAFVGYTPAGPADQPTRVFNFGEYERTFGGLAASSPVSYGVSQFFRNGGGEAWIVRVASGSTAAAATLRDPDDHDVLTVEAVSAGAWGNYLQLQVDYATVNPAGSFNLIVTEFARQGTALVVGRIESFQNLSMNSASAFFVDSVVNTSSQLVRTTRAGLATEIGALGAGTSASGDLATLGAALPAALQGAGAAIVVSVDGGPPITVNAFDPANPPANLGDLATSIAAAINAESAAGVTAAEAGDVITVTSDLTGDETSAVTVTNAATGDAARTLKLGVANGGVEVPAVAPLRPAQTGTTGAPVTVTDFSTLNSGQMDLNVELDTGSSSVTGTVLFGATQFTTSSTLADVALELQARMRALDPASSVLSETVVSVLSGALRVVVGGPSPSAVATFVDAGATTLATDLGLATGTTGLVVNVRRYAPGLGEARRKQSAVVQGFDGTKGGAGELIGSQAARSGVHALQDVDLFNLLCIPETAALPDPDDQTVISAAAGVAQSRRAFYVLDPPNRVDSITAMEAWHDGLGLSSKNAAVYFPRVRFADPVQNFRLGTFAPSGTLAGLYARTDANRGVWKAPAGTEASLTNVSELAVPMTDDENGVLNKLGINCLRSFPVYGRVAWGARTTDGADQKASEWKYVPVRRTALYMEESLFRGLKWVVFEPNGEGLWAQIRLNVGAFMHNLFRQGAFKGTSPSAAYFVKCDAETTTQNDIDLGIVNILVGFAPLKPAEFVILKLQQIAGQVET